MEVSDDGTCTCLTCGKTIEPQAEPDYDPSKDELVELPDDYFAGPEKCPHGNEWSGCDKCDYLSDIAYDAARERGR